MLVHQFLERVADESGERTAVIDATGEIAYAELERRANQYAHLLTAQGVDRGDRVVLSLENSAAWVAWYFAILKTGAVAVPLPHGAKNDRLESALTDCSPRACVTDAKTAAAAPEVLTTTQVLISGQTSHALPPEWLAADAAIASCPHTRPEEAGSEADLAAIIYTSGSTGRPRGVMLTHANFRANTESIVSYLKLDANDRVIVVLPLHYVYGLSLLHTHAYVGGSLLIENRFAFPNVALRAMQEHRATGLAGVPSTFALLLHRSSIATMRFPALRYVTQAGGPMAPALIRQWKAAVPDVPFFVMYGATEAAARLAYLEPSQLDARMGSIGKAIPNVELRLLDDNNVEVAPGEVGEIVARGPNISQGYWNAPDETALVFGAEGYHTGDLARADADGFLYIVGRKRDMLKVGAHRVGAKEIEDVLQEHAEVHEAAVVGAPHDLLGETPIAYVSLRSDAKITESGLLQFCRGRLAEYKVPGRIVVVSELPKNDAGKVDKRALRTLGEPAAVGEDVR